MSILITGASGFVGLNLAQRLLADGSDVVCYSTTALPPAVAAQWRRLPGKLSDVPGDVRNRALLARTMATHGVSQVVHMAAITAGAERERHAADEILSVNLAGLGAVITAAAEAGVRRIVNTGSIAVYGGQPADGSVMDENTPHAPQSLYALSKSSGEAVVARLAALHSLEWVTARLGRVFGPYEHDTGVRDTLSQVHQATESARAGQAVHFARPCVKNWSYAPDVAADLQVLLMAGTWRHRSYNLGTPHAWPLSAWCARLAMKYPGFRYTLGETAPDAADAPDGTAPRTIDLGGPRDSGLLSWQRFDAEFPGAARHDLDAAFDHYMTFLDTRAPALPGTRDKASA